MESESENQEKIQNISINQGIISESDLFDVYESQYNNLFHKILKLSEEKFFALLQEQVLLNLRIINKLSDLALMSFFQELISERYKADKEKALKDLDFINKLNKDEITFLNYNNCYIHCKNNLDIEHKCGNKLILFKDFIYCINCKKVYNENLIKLFCKKCNAKFISKLRDNNEINIINNNNINNEEYEEEILYPVTFAEKHECKNDSNLEKGENEKIKCLECSSDLYLNLLEKDDNFLICIKCQLIFDIRTTKFKCAFCGNVINGQYKLYNGFSDKNLRRILLVHTLRKEKKAFPDNLNNKKCKCDFKELKEFKHKEDNGDLLEGNIFGYKKVICGQCFQIWDKNDFMWTCPYCGGEFIEGINQEQKENIIELEKEIKNEEIEENKENDNNEKKEEGEKYGEKEEEKGEGYDIDIYNENFEDYEEYKEELKDNKKEEKKIEDKKKEEKKIEDIKKEEKKIEDKKKDEKKEKIEIYEYKKEKDINEMININNNYNKNEEIKEKKDSNETKSKQSTNKAYNVIENNKTIKIDLPPQINIKNENKNKITEENKIKNKKYYIENQYHYSKRNNNKEKNNNIKNEKDLSSKIIIKRRNKNNIIESKYSSNQKNKNDKNNNYINTREKNKNNNKSNHQMTQIKEINKKILNRNNTTIEKVVHNKEEKKEAEKNKQEFKNIQKYFDDFKEEYVKELEDQEEKKKKILKNNNLKVELNNNKIQNINNVLYNIPYIDKNKDKTKEQNNTKEKKSKSNNKLSISQSKTNNVNLSNNLNINNTKKNTYKSITVLNSSNYKNIKVLGQGSYGKIYLVEDINTKEQYAMKKLILGDELELKDNQDEYNMIMQISSAYPEINIIHVYATETKNFDEYNFVFYVLMEVANCDWEKELINRSKHKAFYTEEEITCILQGLIDTLAYLQQIGVCHRDIKPQNILCFGEKGYKISDFGEAKFRKKWRYSNNIEGYTSMQTVRGTELYMSPILYNALKTEPSKGVNHNVFKSDVFSLGMCFLFASCLDYKCLYDMRKVRNMNDVKKVVNRFVDNKYSNYFSDTLVLMLNLKEKERPDFIELSNMI